MKCFTVNIDVVKNKSKITILPNTHCSDRTLLPSGLLPLNFPMQIPAWRTLLQTVPPQSWISSTRLWVGGWECWDTNIGGWFWNRSCWCSPADKCLWRRQTWEKNPRAKFSYRQTNTFGVNGMQTIWSINRWKYQVMERNKTAQKQYDCSSFSAFMQALS